nr:MAG TPA: hypothetical protein [Caudoviricetes sp.]
MVSTLNVVGESNRNCNASNYGAPEQLFSGEIGRIDDVRLTA